MTTLLQLAANLEAAVDAARTAETANHSSESRLFVARVKFLRAIGAKVQPVADLLIARGADAVEIKGTNLFLARDGTWRGRARFTGATYPLDDQGLGQSRVSPLEVVAGLTEALRSQANGRSRACEKLDRLSRAFEALLAIAEL